MKVQLWSVDAVYALHNGDQLVYVGEGKLGQRLLTHRRVDLLAGRWNNFTWVSPWTVDNPGANSEEVARLVAPSASAVSFDAKTLGEVLELILIRLANPPSNSQLPRMDQTIKWLTQLYSEHSDTTVASAAQLIPEVMNTVARLEQELAALRG